MRESNKSLNLEYTEAQNEDDFETGANCKVRDENNSADCDGSKTKTTKRKVKICQDCGASFSSSYQLKIHFESKCGTIKKHVCSYCNSKFLTIHTLKTHQLIHTGEKKHLCNYCGNSYLSKGELKVHERKHTQEKPFKCQVCSKSFAYRESLVTHSSLHSGIKPYYCECCSNRFSCIGNLIKHRKSRPETCGLPIYSNKKIAPRPSIKNKGETTKVVIPESKNIKIISDQVIEKAANISNDVIELTENREISASFEYKQVETIQEFEELVFKPDSDFENSVKIEEYKTDDQGECIIYEVGYSDETQKPDEYQDLNFIGIQENVILRGSKFDENVYLTQVQAKVGEIGNEKIIEERILDQYDDDTTENKFDNSGFTSSEDESNKINFQDYIDVTESGYQCKICPKIYVGKHLSIKHLKSVHNVLIDNYDYADLNRYRKKVRLAKFSCKVCGRKYTSMVLLNKHQKSHGSQGDLQHKCSCCKIYFKTREEVEEHQISAHLDRLECKECNKIYNHPDNLHNHQKYAHSDSKKVIKYNFICSICSKNFTSKVALSDHERSLCGAKPIYKCHSCEKYYHSAGSLKFHQQTIHTDQLKYPCSFCEKSLRTLGQKKVHERSHTKEKPYSCDQCPKQFSHRESLITHRSIHTGIKKFECTNCNQRFSCFSNLLAHRRTHKKTCGAVELPKTRKSKQ